MSGVEVAAVILAAGASRRMGRPKQLIEYKGETLLARAIRLAREAELHPVIVVLGAEHDTIRARVETDAAVVVINQEWQEGMASSMRAALTSIDSIAPKAAAVLIMSCDQPRLSAEHLHRLREAFTGESAPCIVASFYAGARGVPAVLPRLAFAKLQSLQGDTGARKVLADPPCTVVEVPFWGGEVDIDVPGDLSHLE